MNTRLELVAAIHEVLDRWRDEHGQASALQVLDALGYSAGMIFSQSPEEHREHARQCYLAAIDAGMANELLVDDRMRIN